MNELTSQDINLLIEALNVWEKEPFQSALQTSIVGTVFAGISTKDGETRESAVHRAKNEGDTRMKAAEQEVKLRRERSIFVQAKLLTMRNAVLEKELK